MARHKYRRTPLLWVIYQLDLILVAVSTLRAKLILIHGRNIR